MSMINGVWHAGLCIRGLHQKDTTAAGKEGESAQRNHTCGGNRELCSNGCFFCLLLLLAFGIQSEPKPASLEITLFCQLWDAVCNSMRNETAYIK